MLKAKEGKEYKECGTVLKGWNGKNDKAGEWRGGEGGNGVP